jgi:hypothetical protein
MPLHTLDKSKIQERVHYTRFTNNINADSRVNNAKGLTSHTFPIIRTNLGNIIPSCFSISV